MGAAWLHQWGGSHGMGHRCPMAPSVFWGAWAPLAWASWAQTGSGLPRPKWKVGGTRICPTLGSSTNELKSKEDPFGGTGLAGTTPFQAGVGRRVLLGWVSPEAGKKESLSFLPRTQGASQIGPSQSRLTLTPFLRVRSPSTPALTWRPTGVSEAKG